MLYKTTQQDDITIVKVLEQDVVSRKAIEFRDYINKVFSEGSKKIVIDFTHSHFMDSTFLGMLVSLLKKITTSEGKLKLVLTQNSDIPIWMMFKMTNMLKVFDVYSTIEEAIESF